MSVKVVRMQNGEDVVADVKEIRPESGKSAIAYEFLDAFTVQILRSTEDMFSEEVETPMDELGEIQLEFFPWSPLATGRNIVTLYSVVAISDPHSNVIDGWKQAIEKYKSLKKDNAEIDYTQTPPPNLSDWQDNGDGRGTEPTD
mgnify:FL=1|tara:strand:+ start:71 stop:502 length:432 start_codon:yes stop_codon:yes gene_type:complete